METFCIEMPSMDDKEAWENFQKFMDFLYDEHVAYEKQLSSELGISEECARDVVYLRTRSRHTPELEEELIALHKAGTPPNVNEFGCGTVKLI